VAGEINIIELDAIFDYYGKSIENSEESVLFLFIFKKMQIRINTNALFLVFFVKKFCRLK